MVAKSERLKELEAKRRALKEEESRLVRINTIVTGLTVFHRLEAGVAFEAAEKLLAHPRAVAHDARAHALELEGEELGDAIRQERNAIEAVAYAEAMRTGKWPDGSPFVPYGGPVLLPPTPAPEETPATPPAAPKGEAGAAPIPPEPRESDDPDVEPAP